MDRQRVIGWGLLLWSAGYILYVLKVRLLVVGPPLSHKEWVYFILAFVGVFLGTMNVRMAAARRRRMGL